MLELKNKRKSKVIEIIKTYDIENQEELLCKLKEEGFNVTQATVSRDIKELRIVKELDSTGTYRYSASKNETKPGFSNRLNTIVRECVTGFDYAQNIVVVNTLPGLASAACSALDGMKMPQIVGTIAGDDTAFILMRDTNLAMEFCEEIKRLLQ